METRRTRSKRASQKKPKKDAERKSVTENGRRSSNKRSLICLRRTKHL